VLAKSNDSDSLAPDERSCETAQDWFFQSKACAGEQWSHGPTPPRWNALRARFWFLHLSPFSKGIEALRKLRRAFCGRGPEKTPS